MLGEMVDCDYETKTGTEIQLGEAIGWLEGFKATTDIYSVANGEFLGCNPELERDPELFFKKPYVEGWLYSVKGEMDPDAMDVESYANFLDESIEKMQGAEA
jgi:glycine cleavage system H protein